MHKKLINYLGLTGLVAFVSYAAAVMMSPAAYPGYDWMAQAVSDLSAEGAPSRMLWNQLAAPYGICNVVCATCATLYVSERQPSTRTCRLGIYLFTLMCWVSKIGYDMFPLSEAGTGLATFQDMMHIAVTALVVILSIVSLVMLMIAGRQDPAVRGLGTWAAVAFVMMLVGAAGQGLVPPTFFGVVERFSVFAAVGFNAVLGMYLFRGFPEGHV